MKSYRRLRSIMLVVLLSAGILSSCGKENPSNKIDPSAREDLYQDEQGIGILAEGFSSKEWAQYVESNRKVSDSNPKVLEMEMLFRFHAQNHEYVTLVDNVVAPCMDGYAMQNGCYNGDIYAGYACDLSEQISYLPLDSNNKITDEEAMRYTATTIHIPDKFDDENNKKTIACQKALLDLITYDNIDESTFPPTIYRDEKALGHIYSTFKGNSNENNDDSYIDSYFILTSGDSSYFARITPLRIENDGTIIAMYEELLYGSDFDSLPEEEQKALDAFYQAQGISNWK